MKTRLVIVAALVAAGTALALGRAVARSDDPAALSAADRQFVLEAAMGGMMEVKAGDVASDRAANAAVKEFGQRMVRDHGKANVELTQLATQVGVQLPKELDAKHAATVERLTALSGAQFDQAYMRLMVEDHVKDVAAFQTEAEKGSEPRVKAWAAKTLPTLKEHLAMAREVAKKVGVNVAAR
jgi:putative membrane protein